MTTWDSRSISSESLLWLEPCSGEATIGNAIGDRRLQTHAACVIGWSYAARGDWEEGIAALQHALDCSPGACETPPLFSLSLPSPPWSRPLSKGTPEAVSSLILSRMSRARSAVPRLVAGRCSGLPLGAGTPAIAAPRGGDGGGVRRERRGENAFYSSYTSYHADFHSVIRLTICV